MTLNVRGIIIKTDPSKPPEIRVTRLVCEEGQVQSGATCGKRSIILPDSYWVKPCSDITHPRRGHSSESYRAVLTFRWHCLLCCSQSIIPNLRDVHFIESSLAWTTCFHHRRFSRSANVSPRFSFTKRF